MYFALRFSRKNISVNVTSMQRFPYVSNGVTSWKCIMMILRNRLLCYGFIFNVSINNRLYDAYLIFSRHFSIKRIKMYIKYMTNYVLFTTYKALPDRRIYIINTFPKLFKSRKKILNISI